MKQRGRERTLQSEQQGLKVHSKKRLKETVLCLLKKTRIVEDKAGEVTKCHTMWGQDLVGQVRVFSLFWVLKISVALWRIAWGRITGVSYKRTSSQ